MNKFFTAALAILTLTTSSVCIAAEHEFYFGDPTGRDQVRFTSDAPLELISGHTGHVNGTVKYDDCFVFDEKHPFEITFNVDLNDLDTDIPLRNEHMRDNFLQTKQYPTATFHVVKVLTSIRPPFQNGQVVNLMVTGDLTVHGKTVRKTLPIKVTYFTESPETRKRIAHGNLIRVQASFPVNLAEHGIQRPEVIFQKLAETVYVNVDAFGTDAPNAFKDK
jgi:polyisoprenoid-binding protein YceI